MLTDLNDDRLVSEIKTALEDGIWAAVASGKTPTGEAKTGADASVSFCSLCFC